MEEIPFRNINLSTPGLSDRQKLTPNNQVTTAKYQWWNFIFLNLFQQYKKLANIYFLIIMGLQLIIPISTTGGKPTMLPPIIIVIGVTMIKDGYEDYKRHKADKAENQMDALVFDRTENKFVKRPW